MHRPSRAAGGVERRSRLSRTVGATRRAPLLATLAVATALSFGPAHAQGNACAGLDAPVSTDVQAFAGAVIESMHAENRADLVRPYVQLQGWPTLTWGDWKFQHPPTWVVRDFSDMHGWVSDPRDASHLLFVIQTQTPGNPTVEVMLNDVLRNTIGPHTPCDRVTFVASDTTRRWFELGSVADVGMVYLWVFRWVDHRFGPMIASLKLDVQARGVYTAYGYVLTSTPEAELAATVRDAFAPMAATFQGSLGGFDRDDKPKKKKDGEEEDED